MKTKVVRALILATVIALVSIFTTYASGQIGGGDIYTSGNTITGYCYVGYSGGTPYYLMEAASLYVKGYNTPVSSNGTNTYNSAGPLYAYTHASVSSHHGEKMYVSCHHYVQMNDGTWWSWYTTSNKITIP